VLEVSEMAMLAELGGVSSLIHGVNGLVKSLRQPTLKSEDFAQVLRQRMQQESDPAVLRMRGEKLNNAVLRSGSRFLDLRDADGDQMLSLDESGLDKRVFKALDANNDGKLSLDEISKPGLDRVARLYPEASTHGTEQS